MSRERQRLGKMGELLVAEYLQRKGYTLIEHGWRCRHGEIDLVMEESGTLVLIEVRTRRGSRHGAPEESLTAQKRARLALLAAAYLYARALAGRPWCNDWRIDVVAVQIHSTGAVERIAHFQHAVEQ